MCDHCGDTVDHTPGSVGEADCKGDYRLAYRNLSDALHKLLGGEFHDDTEDECSIDDLIDYLEGIGDRQGNRGKWHGKLVREYIFEKFFNVPKSFFNFNPGFSNDLISWYHSIEPEIVKEWKEYERQRGV